MTLICILIMAAGIFELMGWHALCTISCALIAAVLIFITIVSIYIESYAKRETETETYKLVKIGSSYYKKHEPWKRLILYKDNETGDVDSFLCDENDFEIINGDEETVTIKMITPVYPKWMDKFRISPRFGEPTFRIIITVPNETEQQNVEKSTTHHLD